MNRIFRVIWNRTLHLWQCVNEKVRRTSKAGQTQASTVGGTASTTALWRPGIIGLVGAGLLSGAVNASAEDLVVQNGSVVIDSARTYDKAYIRDGGVLRITQDGSLGNIEINTGSDEPSGDVPAGSGLLEWNQEGDSTRTPNNRITGTGSMLKTGDGTLAVTGGSRWTFSGTTYIRGGTLRLSESAISRESIDTGSDSDIGGISAGNGVLEFATPANWSSSVGRYFYGSGEVHKTGNGLLSLAGYFNNSTPFTGSLIVKNGTVEVLYGVLLPDVHLLRVSASEDGATSTTYRINTTTGSIEHPTEVVIGDADANENSTNTLIVNRGQLVASSIRTELPANGATATVRLREGAELVITDGTTDLFAGFGASGRGDRVEIGLNGAKINVLEGVTVKQATNAALIDATVGRETEEAVEVTENAATHHLTKTGAGTLVITAHNTYGGNTYIRGGVLRVTETGSLGTGSLIDTGSTDGSGILEWNQENGQRTIDQAITGNGSVLKTGDGTVVVNQENRNFSGTTYIRGGTLRMEAGATLGDGVIDTGADSNVGNITAGKGTLELAGTGPDTWDQLIIGTGSVKKTTRERLALNHHGNSIEVNDFSFSGPLEVTNGLVELQHFNQLSKTEKVLISASEAGASSADFWMRENSALALATSDGAEIIVGDERALAGTNNQLRIQGAEVKVKSLTSKHSTESAAKVIFSDNATVHFTDTTIAFYGFNTSSEDRISLERGGVTFEVDAGKTVTQADNAAIISSTYSESIGAYAEPTTQHVTKTGAGTFVVTAQNTYGGNTYIRGGVLRVKGEGTLGNGEINTGSTTAVNGIDAGSGVLEWNQLEGEEHTITQAITGNGVVLKTGVGKVTVNQANPDFSGTTYIRGGTLRLEGRNTTLGTGEINTGSNQIIDGIAAGRGTLEIITIGPRLPPWQQLITGTGDVTISANEEYFTLDHGGVSLAENDFSFSGSLKILKDKVTLARNNQLSGTTEIVISATENDASMAALSLSSGSQVSTREGVDILVGDNQAQRYSTNMLLIDAAQVNVKSLKSRHTNETDALIGFSNNAILHFMADTTAFEGFKTSSGDKIYIGAGGVTFDIDVGKTVTQAIYGAMTRRSFGDTTTQHFTKTGAGTFVVTAANTYGGNTYIRGGVLRVTSTGLLGAGEINTGSTTAVNGIAAGSGVLEWNQANRDSERTIDQAITGTGAVLKTGEGKVIVTQANPEFSGTTYIRGGTLQVNGGTLGTGVVDTGSNETQLDGLIAAGSGTLELSSSERLVWRQLITGTGNVQKTGNDLVSLYHSGDTANENRFDFTGSLEVLNGQLVLASNQQLIGTQSLLISAQEDGASEAIYTSLGQTGSADKAIRVLVRGDTAQLGSNNVLQINGGQFFADSIIADVAPSVGDTFTKAQVILKEAGDITLTDATEELFMGFHHDLGDSVSLGENGGSLTVGRGLTVTQYASASITDLLNDGELNTHHLTKKGEGTLILTAQNNFGGKLKVEAGTVQLGDGGRAATLGATGAIELAAGTTFASQFSSAYVLGDGRQITGEGRVVLLGSGEGTINRTNAPTYTGNTYIRGDGKLRIEEIDSWNATGIIDTGSNDEIAGVVTGSGTLELTGRDSGEQVWRQLITGTGGLTKVSTGNAVLDHGGDTLAENNFDFTGSLKVTNGHLTLASNNQLTGISRVTISATENEATFADFEMEDGAKITQATDILIGDAQAQENSENTLTLAGAEVVVKSIRTAKPTNDSTAVVSLSQQTLLHLTNAGYRLFEGFTDADTVEIGEEGVIFDVQVAEVKQAASAAMVDSDFQDDADRLTHHLTKTGAGTLVLTAQNTYSGTLTVKEGTLQLGDWDSTAATAKLGGEGNIVLEGGSLTLNVKDASMTEELLDDMPDDLDTQGHLLLKRKITGAGTLQQKGQGTVILLADNNYTGDTLIGVGSTLQVGNAMGNDRTAATLGGGADRAIQNAGRLVFSTVDNQALTRQIAGSGVLEQHGAGELFLDNAANATSFTGNVQVTTGTLRTTSTASLGSGDVLILGTATQDEIDAARPPRAANDPSDSSTNNPEPSADSGIADGGSREPSGNSGEAETLATDTSAETAATTLADNTAPAANGLMRRVRSLRSVVMAAPAAEEPITLTTGEYVADYAEDAEFNHSTVGTGSFKKINAGLLTFALPYRFLHSGATTIDSTGDGGLKLDEGVDLPNSPVTVKQGHLVVDVGEHQIKGLTVENNDAAQVHLLFKSTTNYAKLHATGDVNLNGGTLFVDVSHYQADIEGNFPTDGEMHDVIKSDTALTGTFTKFDDNSALFDFTPKYDQVNEVYFDVKATSSLPEPNNPEACQGVGNVECILRERGHGGTGVAEVLDREFDENARGSIAEQFYSLTTADAVDEAIMQLQPLMTGSLAPMLATRVQTIAALAPRDPCAVVGNGGMGPANHAWAKLNQSWDSQAADGASTGYRGRHSTIAVGSDVCLKDASWRVGAMAAYTDSSITSHGTAALHTAESDLYQIGVYGDKRVTDTQDLDFQVGYARARIDGTRRLAWLGNTKAESTIDANLFYAGVGYTWRGDIVSPFVRFDYSYARSDAYRESGAGVLNYSVDAQSRHSGVAQLGYRFDVAPAAKPYRFFGRVGVGYELLDKSGEVTAAFQGLPNARFTTKSAAESRLMGLFDFGAVYQVSDKVDFGLTYHLTAKPDYRDHMGQVNLTVRF